MSDSGQKHFEVGDEVVEVDGDRVGVVLSYQGAGLWRVQWDDGAHDVMPAEELRLASEVGIGDEIEALEREYEPPSDDFRDTEPEYAGDGFSRDRVDDEIEEELEADQAEPVVRTEAEIDDLKFQWQRDPCWEIEYTEGFEAHYDELKAWRDEWESINRVSFEPLPELELVGESLVDAPAERWRIKREWQVGDRVAAVVLLLDDDGSEVPDGTLGVVEEVTGWHVFVRWENGLDTSHCHDDDEILQLRRAAAETLVKPVGESLVDEGPVIQVETLVDDPLDPDDAEIARLRNDGWTLRACDVTAVLNNAGNIEHHRIMLFERVVGTAGDDRHQVSLGDVLRNAAANMAMPLWPLTEGEPVIDEQDTQEMDFGEPTQEIEVPGEAGPHMFLTAPDHGWLTDWRDAARELCARQEQRELRSYMRDWIDV